MNIRLAKEQASSVIEEIIISAVIVILIPKLFAIFQIRYFPLLYRVTYVSNYQESIFGNLVVDSLILSILGLIFLYRFWRLRYYLLFVVVPSAIVLGAYSFVNNTLLLDILALALTSLSIITLLLPERLFTLRKVKKLRKNHIIAIFFIILTAIEISALVRWAAYPIAPDRIYGNESWAAAKLESSIFHAFGTISVYLTMLLPLSFLLFPFRYYFRKLTSWVLRSQSAPRATVYFNKYYNWIINHKSLVLGTIMLFSALFPALSFLPSVNPSDQSFGVDFYDYSTRIDRLSSYHGFTFFQRMFFENAERPLTILFIVLFQNMFNLTSILAAKSVPIILTPLLVFVCCKFVKLSFGNESLSILSAFLAMTSAYFVIGLYGGFLGNWMAIITMFGLLYFLIKFWRNPSSIVDYGIMLGLLIVLLFIHIYTWTFLVIALTLFLSWSIYYYRKNRLKVIILIAIAIAISVGIDLLKTHFGGVPAGFEVDRNLANQSVSGNLFASRWYNLTYAIGIYLGGGLGNALPLVLALIWIVSAKWKDDANRLIGSLFFVAAPFVLFGDFLIQSRLLYMMPVNVGASLGTYLVATKLEDKRVSVSFLAFMIIYQLNYVLRSISNFYLILPQ